MNEKKPERKANLDLKGPDLWKGLMSPEGGKLAEYTKNILNTIDNNFDESVIDIVTDFKRFPPRITTSYIDSNTHALTQFPNISFFDYDNPHRKDNCFEISEYRSFKIFANESEFSKVMPFLVSAIINFFLFKKADDTKNSSHSVTLLNNPDTLLYYLSPGIDLQSPLRIYEDNVHTLLDVISILIPFSDSPEEAIKLFKRLVYERPDEYIEIDGRKVRINPHGFSYLELFGYAPFGAIASFRGFHPKSIDGENIVDKNGKILSDKFIHTLMRSKFSEEQEQILNRNIYHGGCPVHYPEHRQERLIHRMAEQFIKILDYYEKNSEKINIEIKFD